MSAAARDALRRVLPRITLPRWAWRIDLLVPCGDLPPGESGESLFVMESVLDRDSGEPTKIGAMPYGEPPSLEEGALIDWVYHQLQRHVLHELAEHFLVDGARVRDPHAGEPTTEEVDAMLENRQ